MKRLKETILSHQRALREHPLFDTIEAANSVEPLAGLARAAAWWPMVFQDVLRLNVDRVRGTEFERFAEYHKSEDAGHDRWYLNDLRVFAVKPLGFEELFGEGFQPMRDACYGIMAEVHRHQSDAERIAFLLALETTGHVFFEQISAAVDRVCPHLPLRYFSSSHLGVEKAHDMFSESTEADLLRIDFSDSERVEAEAMVDRIYGTFADMFTFFAAQMTQDVRHRSHVRELSGDAPSGTFAVRRARGA